MIARILFYGSTDFSVSVLEGILGTSAEVVGVVTLPNRLTRVRGKEVLCSNPVKEFAQTNGLPVIEYNGEDYDYLNEYDPNLQVVVAFKILPPAVFEYPEYGTVNLHPSFLPAYRGAAPIPWAIACGEENTGITAFFLGKGIDSGDILLQTRPYTIGEKTGQEMYDLLKGVAKEFIPDVLTEALSGLRRIPQEGNPGKAPKLTKENTFMRDLPGEAMKRFIQGMCIGEHSAWCEFPEGQVVKILRAGRVVDNLGQSGKFFLYQKKIYLHCSDGKDLEILEVQSSGKKRMDARSWWNGLRFSV